MLQILALTLSLGVNVSACDNAFTRGDTLFPQDTSATLMLTALPRVDSTAGFVGILLATEVLAKTSEDPRTASDSALFYLARALERCPDSPVYEAYWCMARMLRVQYRKQSETLLIFDTINLVFTRADSLAHKHPENRAVQLLIGCIFQNAHPFMSKAPYYWGRSRTILTGLDEEAKILNNHSSFYTPEIRANIRLNLAHLSAKDGTESGKQDRQKKIRSILLDFPNTLAAQRARTFLTN